MLLGYIGRVMGANVSLEIQTYPHIEISGMLTKDQQFTTNRFNMQVKIVQRQCLQEFSVRP